MNKISPIAISKLKYLRPNSTEAKVKRSFSPKDYFNHFDLYSRGRKDTYHYFSAAKYLLQTATFYPVNLRQVKDKNGILASYTYVRRKNKFNEKSLYIDSLERNKNNPLSKLAILGIYQDIKKVALKNKIKEITLFVFFKDKNLKKHYERLGFKQDRLFFNKSVDLMRVRTENFINTPYFKTLKLKSLTGQKSIIEKPNIKKH